MRRFSAAAILLVASLWAMSIAVAQQPPQPQPQQPQAGAPPQQSGRQSQPPAGGTAAPPKAIVPLAASTVAANPDPYIGEYVSLTAAVEQNFTKTAFSVDQDKTKSSEKDILVIAPTMTGTVDRNAYVTVLGELVKFDPEEVRKKTKNYTVDLPPDVIAKYKGKPAVVATAVVVNATGVDIAKVLPPPMTAEELAYQAVMKQVGPANTALRAAIDKMDVAAVKEQATILSKALMQTEAFWKAKGKTDATGFATEAKKHADAINAAAAGGKWDDAKAAAAPLGQQCASCHGAYRERLDDGSFRIKMGSK